ncbi:uncharacterized protein LOC120110122 [Phoenix dactylifera]|uniref:Uncharacterized protein LOC120110122 n=1 Tax=Phoenix dactylifera TaxID=42345 RepID=A0A8B9A085_PHODC|nr:uncharacterized protein LOC120110122 [Phoenix dactylifera]
MDPKGKQPAGTATEGPARGKGKGPNAWTRPGPWVTQWPTAAEVERLSRCFPEVLTPPEEPIAAARLEWEGRAAVARSFGRRVPAEWVAKDVAARSKLKEVVAVPLADGYLALRGAAKPSFMSSFKRLVQIHCPEICVLSETRLSGEGLARLRRRLGRDWETYAVESQGLSGGILLLWRRGVATFDVFHNCSQQVVMVVSAPDAPPWVLCGVYASTNHRVRRVLWQEIASLTAQGVPTVVVGDFNCILSSGDKRGGAAFTDRVDRREFRDFVSRTGLVDLGYSGPQFTWCNNQLGSARVWERLDRAFASPDWRLPVRGDAMHRVSRKLELAKRRLRRWNREVVGDIFWRVEGVETAISELQSKEDLEGTLSSSDMGDLRGLLATHHSLLRQHEIFWRQKSRVQWVREGDRNTSFFHRTTIIRRQWSTIHSLRDGSGHRVEGEPSIRQTLLDFFRTRWTEEEESDDSDPIPPPRVDVRIEDDENVALVRPVSAQEVQEAVWALAPDKAPGPDGFPPFFFRRYWGIIQTAVVEAIQCFFSQAVMPGDWKATFITLIPKRQEAAEPCHFRPISLCTTLYKEMMWDLQRASKRHSLMAIKLDMERAYDRIRWRFLQQTLEAYGFHRQWIDWVLGCVRGPKFSILVNGTPPFFESTMGLRQGCPLSPYLFILCADILSRDLQRVCACRELEAYVPAPGASPLSHLLFTDDCLLLARARVSDARVLRRVVADYCMASGQRVNFQKSAVRFSPSTESRVRQEIRGILQIPEQEETLTYLGVPITGRRLRVAECSSLVQRVESRLEGWRAVFLSMMGRLTLIRSVLGSMPVYLMANTVVPKTTLLRIERLLRCFLWGSHGGGRGVHLVAWEHVCRPTSEGGLGVQSLLERREAFIARHAARFLLEPHGLWSQVMAARYGRDGSEVAWSGRRVSFMWREIGRYVPTVSANTRWIVGDGRSIDVTADPWVDTVPLRCWPTMIDTAAAEGLRVFDLLAPGESAWDVARLRQLFGVHLTERIRSLPVPGYGGPDVRVWGTSCRSRVRLGDLAGVIQQEHEPGPDYTWIWRSGLHPRAALFLWKVAWDRLPTRAALSRRGCEIPAECGTCSVEESVDHVLFQCSWARLAWQWAGFPQEVWHGRPQFLQTMQQWLVRPRTCQEAIRATCTAHQIWLALQAGSIVLEGDSATVISWIQKGLRGEGSDHPLVRDIGMMCGVGVAIQAKHVFREANGAAD